MSNSKSRRATEIQDAIRQILYHDWDPIGVCGLAPEDEYDAYIGPVYRILATTRSETELADYLRSEEPEQHLGPVIAKLLAIDVTLGE